MIPSAYSLALLAAAAWRTFQLVADDDILDRPRRWALRLGQGWREEGDPVPDEYRVNWAAFLSCPYCAGFWIAAMWWLAWLAFGDWALLVATPFAISAAVVAGAKLLSREE